MTGRKSSTKAKHSSSSKGDFNVTQPNLQPSILPTPPPPNTNTMIGKVYTRKRKLFPSSQSSKKAETHSPSNSHNSKASSFNTQSHVEAHLEGSDLRGNLEGNVHESGNLEDNEGTINVRGNLSENEESSHCRENIEIISNFILIPSNIDAVSEEVNRKIANAMRQLQIQDEMLTARGVPNDEKLCRYIGLSRKLMPYHVKPL